MVSNSSIRILEILSATEQKLFFGMCLFLLNYEITQISSHTCYLQFNWYKYERSRTMFLSTVVLSFALMSVLTIDFQNFDASLNTENFIVPQAEAQSSDEAKAKAKSSGVHHEIEM